ncbi:MAG TPA: alkaline shock response membrane anchor protein AmaP [Gemmatimonadales bacterium]|nr:alkaline shock response membrane anchor protein AmaP [Gemmatimonadales bacterium]
MDRLNRVLVLIADVVLLFVAGSVAAVALGAVPPSFRYTPWLSSGVAALHGASSAVRAWTAVIAALVFLLALAFAWFELRPRSGRRLVIKDDDLGQVTVARDSVREIAIHEARRVPGVRDVRARVSGAADGFRIEQHVTVDPSVSVPELARALQARVKQAVEHHIGRPVAQVDVETRLARPAPRRRVE